uniref:Putative carboxypeptidase inhibitor n=1 Tax=Rhipicephalus microplus TaxID=6941 RepID=A0A6G5A8I2_RHIMP
MKSCDTLLVLFLVLIIADSIALECKNRKTSCLAQHVCKAFKGKTYGKCFRGVCCKKRRRNTCGLLKGNCVSAKEANKSCHILKSASHSCGKTRICCIRKLKLSEPYHVPFMYDAFSHAY